MDEVTIARLVLGILAANSTKFQAKTTFTFFLGYLREEGCRSTHKDFLKASRLLQVHNSTSSKYVPTRFVGLTLTDILKEYYEIYQTGLYTLIIVRK